MRGVADEAGQRLYAAAEAGEEAGEEPPLLEVLGAGVDVEGALEDDEPLSESFFAAALYDSLR